VTHDEILAEMVRLADLVGSRLRSHELAARTVTLKIRFTTFETITRSVTVDTPVSAGPVIVGVLEPALRSIDPSSGVRLVGVSASNLAAPVEQLSLLEDDSWGPASRAVDEIRDRFGHDAISPARSLGRRRVRRPWG
jgi:DNA polymerase-4